MIYEYLDIISSVFGTGFILIYFYIIFKLKTLGAFSYTEMRHNPLWPLLVFEYKKISKERYGRIGKAYYLLIICFSLAVLSLIMEFLIWIAS